MLDILKSKINLVTLFLFLSMAITMSFSIRHKDIINDERVYYSYAKKILAGDTTRNFATPMPIIILNTLPEIILTKLFPSNSYKFKSIDSAIKAGRFLSIALSLILGLFVFFWSKELYGKKAGAFSLFLYAFSPNILAHSRFVTTDIYVTTAFTITLYYFWKLSKKPDIKNLFIFAFFLALAQLTKYTAILLYFIIPLIFIISKFKKNTLTRPIKLNYLLKIFVSILLLIFITLIIINIGFIFQKTFIPFKDYNFKSYPMKHIQNYCPIANKINVPVPAAYLEGLDYAKYADKFGLAFNNSYLMGKYSKDEYGNFIPFKNYFLICLALKVPIAIQIFFIFAIINLFFNFSFFNIKENEVFLLIPILFLSIYFNYFFNTQIGIRYFLPIFPLVFILCGNIFMPAKETTRTFKIMIISLSLYLMASTLSYFPHFISYFNEYIIDKKQSYRYLANSDLDWDLNSWYLKKFLADNPSIALTPTKKINSLLIIKINHLLGIDYHGKQNSYSWLINKYKPIRAVANSYLVFDTREPN